jgi:hypothetical protein
MLIKKDEKVMNYITYDKKAENRCEFNFINKKAKTITILIYIKLPCPILKMRRKIKLFIGLD